MERELFEGYGSSSSSARENRGGVVAPPPMMTIRFEEYQDSPIFGWQFVGYNFITLPSDLPMSQFYTRFKDYFDPRDEYSYITLTTYSSFITHCHDTCLLPICSYCCCFYICLCLCCPFLYEKKGELIRQPQLNTTGIQEEATIRQFFGEEKKYLRFYRPRFRRGQADIGIWTKDYHFIGSNLLSSDTITKDFLLDSSLGESSSLLNNFTDSYSSSHTHSISNIIQHYNGNRTAKFHVTRCPSNICDKLDVVRHLVEGSYHQALEKNVQDIDNYLTDYKLHLTIPELESVLGQVVTFQLIYYFIYEEFPDMAHQLPSSPSSLSSSSSSSLSSQLLNNKNQQRHVDQIILRRSSIHHQCIPFHLDSSHRTMQILLNSSPSSPSSPSSSLKEYEGGRLVFLTNDRLHIPRREYGTVIIHEKDIVHGVTEMTAGVRYGLFLLQKRS